MEQRDGKRAALPGKEGVVQKQFKDGILSLALLMLGVMLSGCAAPGAGGYGSEPQLRPNSTTTTAATPPTVPLFILLRASAPEEKTISIAFSEIAAQYTNSRGTAQWQVLATAQQLAGAQPSMPLIAGKDDAQALVSQIMLPTRSYRILRLKYQTTNTTVTHEEITVPLVIEASQYDLGDWTLHSSGKHLLTIALDGTKIAFSEKEARLPLEAVTVTPGMATGSIRGQLQPTDGKALRVSAYWGSSKNPFANTLTQVADGAFAFTDLPPGQYRLAIDSDDYHVSEDLKPITVSTGEVSMDVLTLKEKP